MGLAEDYITLDATALADLVRLRQVSPAELVETAIARLEQVEPKLAGMAEWTLDQARQAARVPLADDPLPACRSCSRTTCTLPPASRTTTAAASGAAGCRRRTASWSGASRPPG